MVQQKCTWDKHDAAAVRAACSILILLACAATAQERYLCGKLLGKKYSAAAGFIMSFLQKQGLLPGA